MLRQGLSKRRLVKMLLFPVLSIVVCGLAFKLLKYGRLFYIFNHGRKEVVNKLKESFGKQESHKVNIIVIVVDGGRPDAYVVARAINIFNLTQRGAYTFTAKTIMPSWTLPAHISLGTGLGSEKHGLISNRIDFTDPKVISRLSALVTVFDFAQLAGLRVVGICMDNPKTNDRALKIFANIGGVDHLEVVRGGIDKIIDKATLYLNTNDYILLGVHLGEVDEVGHEYGWMSPEQLEAVRHVDEVIGRFLVALDNSVKRDNTYVIVTSDHGGHGKDHGMDIPEDMTIPWFIVGPGVRAGHKIRGVLDGGNSRPVRIYDTAATILHILGMKAPSDWDGRPVLDAFRRDSLLSKP